MNIRMPTQEENAEITAAALSDPDAQPLSDIQLRSMQPISQLLPYPQKDGREFLKMIGVKP